MMKRRLGALLLVLCMALTFVGCGEKEEKADAKKEETAKEDKNEQAADYDKLTVSNKDSLSVTIEYPKGMEVAEGKLELLGQEVTSRGALLTGEDFEMNIAFARIYTTAFNTVTEYAGQFKSNPIYEEKEISGKPAWIRQSMDAGLFVIIGYSDVDFVGLEFTLPGEAKTEDYEKFYKGDVFKYMVDSIKLEEGAIEGDPIESEHMSIIPSKGWYEYESSYTFCLKNDGIGGWVVMEFRDLGRTASEHIGFQKAQWKDATESDPVTIGNNEFQVLNLEPENERTELIAETSDGLCVSIEISGCTVEEAAPGLESLVIK